MSRDLGLTSREQVAIQGALVLTDEELVDALIELATSVIRDPTIDAEDLHELAAVALVLARRFDQRR